MASPLAEALPDRYVLDRELGRGGMATVYLARDRKHDRLVALKVLRPDLAVVLGGERFLREIRLTAQLQHPHILSLLDSGTADGFLFYVMPYIEGETLRDRLSAQGQLPLEEALAITRSVAGALEYAHRRGIIHRDIKPENILLYQGEPMLADFGIALAAATAGGQRLTETGLSIGTPAYMSPEQASADPRLDGRTDQYSLACVLYEMLAGEPPYTGPTAQAIIAKRLSEPVPHLSTVRSIPPSVEFAVGKALCRSPADRFETVADFAAALERVPRRHRIGRRVAMLLSGAGVLGLIVLGAWALWRQPRPVTTHRQLTFSGRAREPAISPDGRWLAYVLAGLPSQGGDRLLVHDLTSSAPTPMTAASAGALWRPTWGGDGSSLLYAAVDTASFSVYAVPAQGGPARRIAQTSIYTRFKDALYTSSHSDSVVVLDLRSGMRRNMFRLSPTAEYVGSMAVSPDGRRLAFVGVKGSSTFLAVSGIDGSNPRRLFEGVPRFGSLAWTPRGDAIYYLRSLGEGADVAPAGDLMKVKVDSRTGGRKGAPTLVLGGAFVRSFAISVDGRNLIYSKAPPRQKIWTMSIRGSASWPTVDARELSSGTSIHGTPDISNDGRMVAFARHDGGTGNIYVTPFDTYEPRPVANSSADEWSPRWSPDGTRIAFTSRDSQSVGVLVLETATGEVRRVSTNAVAPLGSITWSPDGRQILFPVDLGRHFTFVDVETGSIDTLQAPDSVAGFRQVVFSPDGQQVTVNVWPRGKLIELWRGTTSGAGWTRLNTPPKIGLVAPLHWSRDGWIYFLAGETTLWRVAASGGASQRLVVLPHRCSDWEVALAANARRLVCTVSTSESDIWIAEDFDPDAE